MHITVFKMLAIIQMNSQPKPWIKTFSVTWILVILLLSFSCFLRRRKWRTALCITEAALFCWLIRSWASCWIVITRWYFWRSRFCCNLARNHLYVNIWRFFFFYFRVFQINTQIYAQVKSIEHWTVFQQAPPPLAFLSHCLVQLLPGHRGPEEWVLYTKLNPTQRGHIWT